MLARAASLCAIAALCFTGAPYTGVDTASAQDAFPSRPIRVIHGYPAGGGADVAARQFMARLQAVSGKTFVLDNKPGAAGNTAVGLAAQAKPDGYTMVIGSSSNMVGARYFFKDVGFDPMRDFLPVGSFLEGAFVLVTRNETPAKDVKELAAWLNSRPQNRFGFSNQLTQLAGEYYKARMGVKAEPVAYKSAPEAYPDVQSGLVEFMVADGTTSSGLVKSGKLKPIALMTGQRHPAFPGVPTMKELGYADADFSTWWAMYVPAGTDPKIVATLAKWVNEASRDPELGEFLHRTGNAAIHDGPEAVRKRLETEIERWAPLVKAAGIKPQ